MGKEGSSLLAVDVADVIFPQSRGPNPVNDRIPIGSFQARGNDVQKNLPLILESTKSYIDYENLPGHCARSSCSAFCNAFPVL